MAPLLVTGAGGFLGRAVPGALDPARDVVGLGRTNTVPGLKRFIPADITDHEAVTRIFRDLKPDAVMHLAALSSPLACEKDPDASLAVNVRAPVHLARLCAEADVPLAFASTDLVFCGTRGNYTEQDVPEPVNLYGRHKVRAEREVLEAWPRAAVCRLPLLYGPPAPAYPGFPASLVRAARQGKPLALFTDEFRTPALTLDVARGLALVLDAGVSGLVHLGGPRRLSRLEFGILALKAAGLAGDVRPMRQADLDTGTPRPADVSLDSAKARGLGYDPMEPEQGLRLAAGA